MHALPSVFPATSSYEWTLPNHCRIARRSVPDDNDVHLDSRRQDTSGHTALVRLQCPPERSAVVIETRLWRCRSASGAHAARPTWRRIWSLLRGDAWCRSRRRRMVVVLEVFEFFGLERRVGVSSQTGSTGPRVLKSGPPGSCRFAVRLSFRKWLLGQGSKDSPRGSRQNEKQGAEGDQGHAHQESEQAAHQAGQQAKGPWDDESQHRLPAHGVRHAAVTRHATADVTPDVTTAVVTSSLPPERRPSQKK